ncbi:Rieske 2Fe-2S domain-containing protein [uncultured Methylobacterium sp.]|uniref:Rieske 2Fe-2S domain-containing protein n=1 Tax=uncultured Methylobacterium sp. TaxID=157278 RepID=UPI0035CC5AFB
MSPDPWHPIAACTDLPFRHVFHGQLLGQELAVWRADDGHVNVWENRCLHRGVRLSIGVNDGRELACQYHGWRYANRTAGCTYIPAHPADAPARTIANRTFPARERYGLVWAALGPGGAVPEHPGLDAPARLVLRAIPVDAAPERVLAHLRGYAFQPNGDLGGTGADVAVEGQDAASVSLRARSGAHETRAVLLVQPVDGGRAVIRGVLDAGAEARDRIAILRHHDARLSALRERIEAEAARAPAPVPFEPVYARVAPELAEMPALAAPGRRPALRVQVARRWAAAEGVAGFELRPIDGLLPAPQPGAHIDVHLPNGLVRPYSLVNGPGETAAYVIGVKRAAASRGGSQCLHEAVRAGDVLAISEPRNNFPLRRDAVRTLLVAGGIGITPLLAMAQTLVHGGHACELHHFASGPEGLAFPERLAALGDAHIPHLGLDPEETAARLAALLAAYRPGLHVYLCGPPPMLEAARSIAARAGWPEAAVHAEYFENTTRLDAGTSFEVALARSALTLTVPAGRTILDVVRAHGIDLPSSCEQGACGTCRATLIAGEPDHRDVYLSAAERAEGAIITCVSRARSGRLVLDL